MRAPRYYGNVVRTVEWSSHACCWDFCEKSDLVENKCGKLKDRVFEMSFWVS